MPPIFVDRPPSNGGALMLSGITVVGYGYFGESLCVGDDFRVLILSVIYVKDDVRIALKSSMSFIIFSSESCFLAFISCLLDSIAACMVMKFSSDFLSILLIPFGILKIEV